MININTHSSSVSQSSNRDKAESIVSMPQNQVARLGDTPDDNHRRRVKPRRTKVLSEKYKLTGKSLEIFEVLTNVKKKQKVSKDAQIALKNLKDLYSNKSGISQENMSEQSYKDL